MAYQIKIKRSAEKEYKNLENNIQKKVKERIFSLAEIQRPEKSKKLQNRDGYRVRVSDYRIIYIIDDDTELVEIIRIAHRKDIYR